jgi:hypothetical protein
MWSEERIRLGKQLNLAIERGQTDLVRSLCTAHPWLVTDLQWNDSDTWIGVPVADGNVEMMRTLLDLGFNVNALSLPEKSSALADAIANKALRINNLPNFVISFLDGFRSSTRHETRFV